METFPSPLPIKYNPDGKIFQSYFGRTRIFLRFLQFPGVIFVGFNDNQAAEIPARLFLPVLYRSLLFFSRITPDAIWSTALAYDIFALQIGYNICSSYDKGVHHYSQSDIAIEDRSPVLCGTDIIKETISADLVGADDLPVFFQKLQDDDRNRRAHRLGS